MQVLQQALLRSKLAEKPELKVFPSSLGGDIWTDMAVEQTAFLCFREIVGLLSLYLS